MEVITPIKARGRKNAHKEHNNNNNNNNKEPRTQAHNLQHNSL
jgi:hypothetical protein